MVIENNQIKITLPLINDDEEFSSKDAYKEYVNKIGDNILNFLPQRHI